MIIVEDKKDFLKELKTHIRWEEGMDDSMLSFYRASAERYVKKKTGFIEEYLVTMVATVMYEYRVSSVEMRQALKTLEPIFALEVITHGKDDQSITVESKIAESDTDKG